MTSSGVTWLGVTARPLWVMVNRLLCTPVISPCSGAAETASYSNWLMVRSSQLASQVSDSSGGSAPDTMVPRGNEPAR